MSHVMGKPTIFICENKDADQLRDNREDDQRFCFRYTDSTLPLLSKSEISILCLCQTCSETTLFVFPRVGSCAGTVPGKYIKVIVRLNCKSCGTMEIYGVPQPTQLYLNRLIGKPTIRICENKDADQLRGNREADQRLCFRYSDSTIPLLLKFKLSSF